MLGELTLQLFGRRMVQQLGIELDLPVIQRGDLEGAQRLSVIAGHLGLLQGGIGVGEAGGQGLTQDEGGGQCQGGQGFQQHAGLQIDQMRTNDEAKREKSHAKPAEGAV